MFAVRCTLLASGPLPLLSAGRASPGRAWRYYPGRQRTFPAHFTLTFRSEGCDMSRRRRKFSRRGGPAPSLALRALILGRESGREAIDRI